MSKDDDIIREYLKSIQRFVESFVPRSYDQGNIVGELMLEVLIKKRPPTWGWMRWRALDQMRRKKKTFTIDRASDVEVENHGSDNVDDVERIDVMMHKASLNRNEETVIYLRFYQGQTLGQIAYENKISEDKVRVLLDDALEKLRRVG